jgi:hypothetical protein
MAVLNLRLEATAAYIKQAGKDLAGGDYQAAEKLILQQQTADPIQHAGNKVVPRPVTTSPAARPNAKLTAVVPGVI